MDDITQHWLPAVGYEGFYEVSDTGRVRSLDRLEVITGSRSGVRTRRGRVLRSFPFRDGYLFVRLSRDGRSVSRSVHSLVLEAFTGLCPAGMECRHLNGDRQDDRAENLAWGTESQNTLDQVAHGTHRNSRKLKCPKGHDYDYVVPRTGKRQCTKCRRANYERYKRKAASDSTA